MTSYKAVIYGFDQALKWRKTMFNNDAQPCSDGNTEIAKTGIPRY